MSPVSLRTYPSCYGNQDSVPPFCSGRPVCDNQRQWLTDCPLPTHFQKASWTKWCDDSLQCHVHRIKNDIRPKNQGGTGRLQGQLTKRQHNEVHAGHGGGVYGGYKCGRRATVAFL